MNATINNTTIRLPYATLTLNLAFCQTTDFENEKVNECKCIPTNTNPGAEQYFYYSDYYGIFMDMHIKNVFIRACYGVGGVNEVFIVNEDDITNRMSIKITYDRKNLDDSYVQIRRSNGDNKSMHFGNLPIDIQNIILTMNAAQADLERNFNLI